MTINNQQPTIGKKFTAQSSHLLRVGSWGSAARARGFTLLLAALVASIVLTLGASIFDIATKEVTLSSVGRDSQFAFYAADTSSECALYWDSRFGVFATSSSSGAPASQAIECDGQPSPTVSFVGTPTLTAATTTFSQDIFTDDAQSPGGYCVSVEIAKYLNSSTNTEHTVIDANGYDVACSAVDTSPVALQRSVELSY